ncbi:MAG: hypothetical protein LBD13_01465 [Spirochaetaceae bacterium]|jgi:hypothetical protein|nr:hypothetical protein [Spirochaetaceae bacterium]
MKRLVLCLLAAAAASPAFAQKLPDYRAASGKWANQGGRAYQNDPAARLAKANIRAPQSGSMLYAFNVRYESGGEDGHGGFGLHIFADSAVDGPSWGCGNSYLLWLNYDEKPLKSTGIAPGLTGQVYRSYSHTRMELVHNIDLNQYAGLLTAENLAEPVSFRIWANGDTGEVRIYDPTDPYYATYYVFTADKKTLPLKGNWAAVRTNGLRMSFAPEEDPEE